MPPVLDQSMSDHNLLVPLCKVNIEKHLSSYGVGDIKAIQIFSSISSTNDYLLENELAHKEVAICMAEQQTQGRGRYGHQWVSPSAVNLYLSMSWPLQTWKEEYEPLSLWLLIAIADLLGKQGCNNVQLKWPNDICVGNKKLAGILIERKVGQTRNTLVIGVGLNVAMSLNENIEIETPWIDLLSIKSGWQLTRNELAASIIAVFKKTLLKLEENRLGALDSRWRQYDMLLNKRIEFLNKGKKHMGYVKGIDDLGRIILDINGKLEHFYSAHLSEIKLIGTTL